MNAKDTGNKISSLRKEKQMTQKDLAKKLHVIDKAVSKWERGLNYPDLALLPEIADALDTTVAARLGLEHNISKDTITVINEPAQSEKKKTIKLIREFLMLTILLSIVVLFNKWYISSFGYLLAPFNIQFWIDGILIALALTLMTNGVWLLIKYKKFSKH